MHSHSYPFVFHCTQIIVPPLVFTPIQIWLRSSISLRLIKHHNVVTILGQQILTINLGTLSTVLVIPLRMVLIFLALVIFIILFEVLAVTQILHIPTIHGLLLFKLARLYGLRHFASLR